jgi:spore maturation protein CgeB
MYSSREAWPPNIRHLEHVAPPQHPSFYSSAPLTLNVTRGPMAAMGYCPSARFFEAGACGTAVLSDWWTGLDLFFEPGSEILIATSTAEAMSAIVTDRASLDEIARRARQRTLDCHTADQRARRLISLLESPRDERGDVDERAYASRGV